MGIAGELLERLSIPLPKYETARASAPRTMFLKRGNMAIVAGDCGLVSHLSVEIEALKITTVRITVEAVPIWGKEEAADIRLPEAAGPLLERRQRPVQENDPAVAPIVAACDRQ